METLQFSFIGMKSMELPFSSGGNFNVTLQSYSVDLDEIVAVGYGVQKMRNVTGSRVSVNPKEITDLPVGNLGAALRGR
ncbi:MAG: hypothetical protein MZV63_58160 [Marinilabiliales bacterium]|nr:hypothetical protein [Marinilabiliales bacterium]